MVGPQRRARRVAPPGRRGALRGQALRPEPRRALGAGGDGGAGGAAVAGPAPAPPVSPERDPSPGGRLIRRVARPYAGRVRNPQAKKVAPSGATTAMRTCTSLRCGSSETWTSIVPRSALHPLEDDGHLAFERALQSGDDGLVHCRRECLQDSTGFFGDRVGLCIEDPHAFNGVTHSVGSLNRSPGVGVLLTARVRHHAVQFPQDHDCGHATTLVQWTCDMPGSGFRSNIVVSPAHPGCHTANMQQPGAGTD